MISEHRLFIIHLTEVVEQAKDGYESDVPELRQGKKSDSSNSSEDQRGEERYRRIDLLINQLFSSSPLSIYSLLSLSFLLVFVVGFSSVPFS